MGLNWNELRGKTVLDLGAGDAAFSKIAKRHEVNVISVEKNPEGWLARGTEVPLADPMYLVCDASDIRTKDNQVFPSNSVDLIVSRSGPLTIVDNRKVFEKILQESLRVLKSGGELRFGPAPIHTAVVGWDKVAPDETEWQKLSDNEKDEQINKCAIEYLTEIAPEINLRTMEKSELTPPHNQYYVLVKR